jgi:hypothetical protein
MQGACGAFDALATRRNVSWSEVARLAKWTRKGAPAMSCTSARRTDASRASGHRAPARREALTPSWMLETWLDHFLTRAFDASSAERFLHPSHQAPRALRQDDGSRRLTAKANRRSAVLSRPAGLDGEKKSRGAHGSRSQPTHGRIEDGGGLQWPPLSWSPPLSTHEVPSSFSAPHDLSASWRSHLRAARRLRRWGRSTRHAAPSATALRSGRLGGSHRAPSARRPGTRGRRLAGRHRQRPLPTKQRRQLGGARPFR